MASIKIFFFLIFLSLSSPLLHGEEQSDESHHSQQALLPLRTKIDLRSIRFIDKEGRFTYYQQRSGHLSLSTNFSVETLLTGPENTQYQIISDIKSDSLIIEKKIQLHSDFNIRSPVKLYSTSRGSTDTRFLGNGEAPALHLNGQWLSFYNRVDKIIRFQNFSTPALNFNIQTQSQGHPYFTPQAKMLNERHMAYTDINQDNVQGLLIFDRQEGEITTLFTTSSSTQHLNICSFEDTLIIQEVSIQGGRFGSLIHKVPISNLKIDALETIYQSAHNDLSTLICDRQDNAIYFIQNTREKTGRNTTDVARIARSEENYPVEVLTQLNFVTQLIKVDGSLLIPYREDIFVLRGQSDLTDDRLLQSELLGQ